MAINTTPKTKKPTGLKIERSDTINSVTKKMSFTANWKIADSNYADGQQMYYKISDKSGDTEPTAAQWKKIKSHSVNIGKKATSKTFYSPNFSSFHPVTANKYLRWIHIGVRGNRESYTKKVNKKNVTIKPTWSDYAEKTYRVRVPSSPVNPIDVSRDNDRTNVCSFSWQLDSSQNHDTRCFYDFQWQSILVKDSAYENAASVPSAIWNACSTGHGTAATSSDPGYTDADGTKWKFENITDGDSGFSCSGSTHPGESSGFVTITEDSYIFYGLDYSYTRYIRVRSRGPAGNSDWAYGSFVYSRAPQVDGDTIRSSFDVDNTTGGYILSIRADVKDSFMHPADTTTHRYAIVVPDSTISQDASGIMRASVMAPSDISGSWVDVPSLTGSGVTFTPIDLVDMTNKMIFVQVVTKHDNYNTSSITKIVPNWIGKLSMPTNFSVDSVDYASTHRITVNAENPSDVAASYIAVYYRTDIDPSTEYLCGIIPHGESTVTVQLPTTLGDTRVDIGVRTMLANYRASNPPLNASWYVGSPLMQSDHIEWRGGEIPLPPSNVELSSPSDGTIHVNWDWTWDEANSAELSWADHEDAWESTSGPETYTISNTHSGSWNISGLSIGTWYVRVRLIKTYGDASTYGTYSPIRTIKLVSAPTTPNLRVSPSLITEDGSITCTWIYSSEDGSGQQHADICLVEVDDHGTPVPGAYDNPVIIASADTEEYVTIDLSNYEEATGEPWTDGQKLYLSIKVISDENQSSLNWSKPVAVQIANKPAEPVITFSQGSGMRLNQQVIHDEVTTTENVLYQLPLIFSISDVGSANSIRVMIERAEDYPMDRPDEDEVIGYEGDIAYLNSDIVGNSTVTISQSDLLDYLDDGADYILTVSNSDNYGQSEEAIIPFIVKWDHQAVKPLADVVPDLINYQTLITPRKPAGWAEGDTVDIYRLSIDKPELIIESAEFDTTYVDPYPALNLFGGHRIVYKTYNGDYTMPTDDGSSIAWTDYGENEDNIIEEFATIFDFNGERVVLRYNLTLSNQWTKDFVQTRYLGGSMQGDWNPGVERSTSINGVIALEEDPLDENQLSTIEGLRRLAIYPGICHVRTPDGSSFDADVQVNEDREEKWISRLAKFAIKITRVDSQRDHGGIVYSEQQTQ